MRSVCPMRSPVHDDVQTELPFARAEQIINPFAKVPRGHLNLYAAAGIHRAHHGRIRRLEHYQGGMGQPRTQVSEQVVHLLRHDVRDAFRRRPLRGVVLHQGADLV